MTEEPHFISLEEAVLFHREEIKRAGGAEGIRDPNGLAAALAAPQATFGGSYLLGDLFAMAAAYVESICTHHPFIDGNKRTGTACALVFLLLNGYEIDEKYDEELADYTRRHRGEKEERAEEIRASQILVRTREEASKARARIKGGEDFAAVAEEVSLSPDGERGGDLGYFSRGQMPQEFDAVVFNLKTGRLSRVIETTYGYHLFLVTDRREAHQKSDEEVEEEIRRILLAEKGERAFRSWVASLRESAQIRYNDNILSP